MGVRDRIVTRLKTLTIAVSLSLAGSVTGCNPAAPTPMNHLTLTIRPSDDALKIGETTSFSAWIRNPDGAERQVTARWISENAAVMSIDNNGIARALTLGSTRISATFEQLEVARVFHVLSDFSGVWTGFTTWTDCVRLSGSGPSPCNFTTTGGFTTTLRLTQTHRIVSGDMTVYADRTNGPVSGTVDDSNTLTLTGTLTNLGNRATVTIMSWGSTLDLDGNRQSGHFIARVEFVNGFGQQVDNESYELLNIPRQ